MKTLTLALDPASLHANPVHRALTLIRRLRDEGIPAFGAIALEGVESGTLSITAPDLLTGEVTYSWTDFDTGTHLHLNAQGDHPSKN